MVQARGWGALWAGGARRPRGTHRRGEGLRSHMKSEVRWYGAFWGGMVRWYEAW